MAALVEHRNLQQHASTIRLMDYIPKLADKWREIGTLLGEEDSVLLMESQPSAVDPINCMRRIFKSWIDSGERTVSDVTIKPTWEYLVKTLRNTSVNKGSIADDIERMIITLNVEDSNMQPWNQSIPVATPSLPTAASYTINDEHRFCVSQEVAAIPKKPVYFPVINKVKKQFSKLASKMIAQIRDLEGHQLRSLRNFLENYLDNSDSDSEVSTSSSVVLPDSCEELIIALQERWDWINILVVQAIIDFAFKETLLDDLKRYEKALQMSLRTFIKRLRCRIRSIQGNSGTVAFKVDEKEAAILKRILDLKDFLIEELRMRRTTFEGLTEGCLLVYFSMAQENVESLMNHLPSYLLRLALWKVISVTGIGVFYINIPQYSLWRMSADSKVISQIEVLQMKRTTTPEENAFIIFSLIQRIHEHVNFASHKKKEKNYGSWDDPSLILHCMKQIHDCIIAKKKAQADHRSVQMKRYYKRHPKRPSKLNFAKMIIDYTYSGELAMLKRTIGAVINPLDIVWLPDGDTLLHTACRNRPDNPDVVSFLIEDMKMGKQLNNKNDYGMTPFLRACEDGKIAIIKLLVTKYRTNILDREKHGINSIEFAARSGRLDLLQYLLQIPELAKLIHQRDQLGEGVMHNGCQNDIDNPDVVSYLIEQMHLDPHIRNKNGATPLMKACWYGNLSVVKLLMDKYKMTDRLEEECNEGQTPLIFATIEGNLNLIKELVEVYDVNIFHRTHKGMNVLHYAAGSGYLVILKYLMPKFIAAFKLHEVDKFGNNVLFHACTNEIDNPNMVSYLIDERKFSLEMKNNFGGTALMQACLWQKLSIVRLLINKYKVNIKEKDFAGRTAISIAQDTHNRQIITALSD